MSVQNFTKSILSNNVYKLNNIQKAFVTTIECQERRYDNIEATKLIKNMYSLYGKQNSNIANNKGIVQNAFDIYNKIGEQKNYFIINTMMKLCLQFKHPQKIMLIWNEMEQLIKEEPICNIKLLLALKCCVTSLTVDINKCIQILQWMKSYDYQLQKHEEKEYSVNITKLISKCNNKEQLQEIHHLILESNIFVETALIKSYSKYSMIDNALNVFNSIPFNDKDAILLGVMMKCLMNNNCFREVLTIYSKHQQFHDNVLHLMALKACTKLKRFDKGKQIHSTLKLNHSNIELKTALIDFYGNCGDIPTALNILNSINELQRNTISINAMLTVLVNNNCNYQALSLYQDYLSDTNDISHIMAIKACIKINDYEQGKEIHSNIASKEITSSLKHTLIDFYGYFKDIDAAQNIFNSINIENRNSFSVGAMMKAFINNGMNAKVSELYHENKCLHNMTNNSLNDTSND